MYFAVCDILWFLVTYYTTLFIVQVPLSEYDFSIKKLYNIQSQVSLCVWIVPVIASDSDVMSVYQWWIWW